LIGMRWGVWIWRLLFNRLDGEDEKMFELVNIVIV
jgi:hypothetical protein